MNQQAVKWGILACGNIANAFAKALKEAEVAKRAARYSRNEAKTLASERELNEMDQVGGSGL
jgi:predicted dehydrogenase